MGPVFMQSPSRKTALLPLLRPPHPTGLSRGGSMSALPRATTGLDSKPHAGCCPGRGSHTGSSLTPRRPLRLQYLGLRSRVGKEGSSCPLASLRERSGQLWEQTNGPVRGGLGAEEGDGFSSRTLRLFRESYLTRSITGSTWRSCQRSSLTLCYA